MCSHLLADVQDVCDRIAILYQGELKELGARRLAVESARRDGNPDRPPFARRAGRGRKAIEKQGGEVISEGHPSATLEELFLKIIAESEAHPGRRVRGVAARDGASGGS